MQRMRWHMHSLNMQLQYIVENWKRTFAVSSLTAASRNSYDICPLLKIVCAHNFTCICFIYCLDAWKKIHFKHINNKIFMAIQHPTHWNVVTCEYYTINISKLSFRISYEIFIHFFPTCLFSNECHFISSVNQNSDPNGDFMSFIRLLIEIYMYISIYACNVTHLLFIYCY